MKLFSFKPGKFSGFYNANSVYRIQHPVWSSLFPFVWLTYFFKRHVSVFLQLRYQFQPAPDDSVKQQTLLCSTDKFSPQQFPVFARFKHLSNFAFKSINFSCIISVKITGNKGYLFIFFSIWQIKCKWPILISSWLPERYLECLQNVGLCLVFINKVIFMLFFLRCRKKMISS